MPIYGGIDWSGTPDATGSILYCPTLITVNSSLEDLQNALKEMRPKFHMRADEEFHGHETSDRMRIALLEIALSMELRVSAAIYDKAATLTGLPAPKDFPAKAALSVIEALLPQDHIVKIWYDEDISGKSRQQAFQTEAQRLNRAYHPNTSLDIRPKPSEGSELIQIADIVAYCLSLMARNMIKAEELRKYIKALRDDTRNNIIGPIAWND